MIYRQQIRSKTEYECIEDNFANCKGLSSLESVGNEAMRIASRYFKYTPKTSPQDITQAPPLDARRDYVNLKY